MKFLRYSIVFVFLFPVLSFAQNKAEREIMRGIAELGVQIQALQSSLDQKTAQLLQLTQQTYDTSFKANTAVASVAGIVSDRLRDQEKAVGVPIAALGSKVDQMASEFQGVKESIADLNSRMAKLQTQLVDIANAVKTLSAPPPPPAPAPGSVGGSGSPPAGMSAEALYQNAIRDKSSGNLDLAMQGFQDYLRFYGATDYAPNAQFYVGDILYQRGNYDEALKAFDMVLEKYSDNNKTADARYMKGQTLLKLNQRNAAKQEFIELIRTSPSSDLATKARAQLKALGINPPSTPSRRKR